jgi:ribosome biogenesis GTPase
MEGIIIAATGGKYVVYSNGITYNVFPKGVFRYKKLNLLVGDKVTFDDETFTIVSTSVRSNELIRPKCANIDQIFVVMSVKQPELSIELIYKFLTYVNMNGITSKVVLTKIDLEDNFNEINTLKEDLEKLGIEVYLVSPFEKETILSLKEQFKNKVSILMGQTGVGKSTLINAIDPSFERKVGEYSDALGRGKHQTKEVLLLPYEG